MIWIPVGLAIFLGKAVYDAVTDDSEQEERDRQARQERMARQEREQAQALSLESQRAQRRTAKQGEILVDARQHFIRFYAQHDAVLAINRTAQGQGYFSWSDLTRFAQQDVPKNSQALAGYLSALISGTLLSAAQCRQDAQIDGLTQEIAALGRLQSTLSKGTSA